MPKLFRRIFDVLPAASINVTKPLCDLAKWCIVELFEVRNVEPLHHPAAIGIALPASVPLHTKSRAVEMDGETSGHSAGGVAQVDSGAIAQVNGHCAVSAADPNQNTIKDSDLIECAERHWYRLLTAGKSNGDYIRG